MEPNRGNRQETDSTTSVHSGSEDESTEDATSELHHSLPRPSFSSSEQIEDAQHSSSASSTVSVLDTDAREIPVSQQTTSIGDDGSEIVLWRSAFLQRSFLIGLAIFFALVICALEIMDTVSRRNDGLATVDQNFHYLWTYGPTLCKRVSPIEVTISNKDSPCPARRLLGPNRISNQTATPISGYTPRTS